MPRTVDALGDRGGTLRQCACTQQVAALPDRIGEGRERQREVGSVLAAELLEQFDALGEQLFGLLEITLLRQELPLIAKPLRFEQLATGEALDERRRVIGRARRVVEPALEEALQVL